MSHIYGHVDTTNTNPPDFDKFVAMAKKLDPTEVQMARDEIGMDMPYGVISVNVKENGKDNAIRQLPYKNEDRIPLPKANGADNVACHIYLTKPYDGNDSKYKNKYRAYASDVVPLTYHREAEQLAVPLLGGDPAKGDTLEAYNPDDIEKVALANFNDKPHLRKVLLQTASYMRSPSFKFLYYDDKTGNLLNETDRLAKMAQHVVFKFK